MKCYRHVNYGKNGWGSDPDQVDRVRYHNGRIEFITAQGVSKGSLNWSIKFFRDSILGTELVECEDAPKYPSYTYDELQRKVFQLTAELEKVRAAKPEFRGYYSPQQERIAGSIIYKTPEGYSVRVTEIRSDASKPNWSDAIYVGRVTDYVRRDVL